MAKTLDVARSEIRRDILQRWDEMDITLLFGINFGRIRTRWKEIFVHFAMKVKKVILVIKETKTRIYSHPTTTRRERIRMVE